MNSEQIFKAFWQILDVFRGIVSPGFVADWPALLFFIKRVTDLASKSIALKSLIRPGLSRETSREFSWLELLKAAEPSRALLSLLREVENTLPELRGLATQSTLALGLQNGGELDRPLREVFSILDPIPVGELSHGEAAAIFQRLLDAMLDSVRKRATSSVTPPSVRELLVRLVSPRLGEAIYDPVCGYGSLICEAARAASDGKQRPMVYGQELSPSITIMAKINAVLNNLKFDIRTGDTLVSPRHLVAEKVQKFDCVFANPPFGFFVSTENLKDDVYGRFSPVVPTVAELAILLHVDHSLSENGRAVILVPQGVLSRMGNDYEVRKRLIEADRIRAIVTLPPHLFPGTPIPVSILLLGSPENGYLEKHIVFVDLSDQAAGPKTKRHLTQAAIENAVRHSRAAFQPSDFSRVVDHSEIAKKDYDLSIARYVVPRVQTDLRSFDEEIELFLVAVEKRDHAEAEALRLLKNVRLMKTTQADNEAKGVL